MPVFMKVETVKNFYRWKQLNPESFKAYQVKCVKGLTPNQIQDLVHKQLGKCLICNEFFKSIPCVDHNHKTGTIRGLLCRECNAALGLFKESIYSLIKAIDYLLNEIK